MIKWPKGEHAPGVTGKKKEIAPVSGEKRTFKRGMDNKCARLPCSGGCRHTWQSTHPPQLRQPSRCLSEGNKSMNSLSSRASQIMLSSLARENNLNKFPARKIMPTVNLELTIAWGLPQLIWIWICQLKRLLSLS